VASVAAPHRAEAFAACERLVELIKSTVPIWKRQHLADGATNGWGCSALLASRGWPRSRVALPPIARIFIFLVESAHW